MNKKKIINCKTSKKIKNFANFITNNIGGDTMDMTYKTALSIIYAENNRAIKKGLVGNLSNSEFNTWSVNWWLAHCLDEFGVRQNDGFLRDPYTGYVINNENKKSKLILEHIIPIDRGGGTVLFNVLPARSDVNSSKLNNDPLEWWITPETGIFNKQRFIVFLNYIFDAYDKRIKDGIFTIGEIFDELQGDNSFFDENNDFDSIDELNITQDKKQNSQKLKKISYGEFLSSCITLLDDIDKKLATTYREKLTSYEKQGIFKDITNYQKIQTILFNSIKEIDSSIKYKFIKSININLLLQTIDENTDIENEINSRINNIKEIIEKEHSTIHLNTLLLSFPNILTLSKEELSKKINIIKQYNLSDDIIRIIRNNSFLLLLPEKEIHTKINEIRRTLGEEYFDLFINTSLQYKDIKILNYIKNCNKTSQLSNLNYQNKEDNLDRWLEQNMGIKLHGSFFNTLNMKIQGRSSKITTNRILKVSDVSKITNILYAYVKNNNELLNQPNQMKNLINKIIMELSEKDIDKMNLLGNSLDIKKNNLINFFYENIDNNLIQNYLYLELIKNKKLTQLEIESLEDDISVIKEYILNAKSLDDLSNKQLELITSNLPNIVRLNGGFESTLKHKLVFICKPENGKVKQVTISKNDIGLVTSKLLEKFDFTDTVDSKILKKEIITIIKEELIKNGNNFYAPLNSLTTKDKIQIIVDSFIGLVDNKSIQNFLMLEQISRQKKNELTLKRENEKKIQKKLEERNMEIKKNAELHKIFNYINNCSSVSQLRFEIINKIKQEDSISLNEWMSKNIDLEILNMNNLYGNSFKISLINKIRSGAAKYSKKSNSNTRRTLITYVIEQLDSQIRFLDNPSKEILKELVNKIIENIASEPGNVSEFDEYKGETIEEQISSFKNLIYKFLDNDTVKLYLLLEQMVNRKKQELIGMKKNK